MPAKKPAPATPAKKPAPATPAKSAKATKAQKPSKPTPPFFPLEQRAYPALVQDSLVKVTVTLAADERAYYEGSIPEADALRDGARVESAGVLDDILQLAAQSLPPVVAGKVAGYGGLRLRYVLELAQALAAKVDRLDTSLVEASGASAAKTTSLRGTRFLRRSALRALKNLAGKRAEDRARMSHAGEGAEKPDERARSLEAIAQELSSIVAKIPARVAADAGATSALMDELRQNAKAVLTTRSDAQGSRGAVYSIYDEMNVLDGRIMHEIRLLVGAMKDARIGDKTIPRVRSMRLRTSHRKKVATPAEAEAAEGEEAEEVEEEEVEEAEAEEAETEAEVTETEAETEPGDTESK